MILGIYGLLLICALIVQTWSLTIDNYIQETQIKSLCNTCLNASISRCRCDAQCPEYGDCCFDSPYHSPGKQRRFNEVCRGTEAYDKTMYMVDSCRTDWKGPQAIVENCQRELYPFIGTLYAKLPVTNLNNNVTYKNYYCALCNDDLYTIPWQIYLYDFDDVLSYNSTHNNITVEYILLNAFYSTTAHRYGLVLWSNDSLNFFGLSHKFEVPNGLEDRLRYCYRTVDKCAPNWTDSRIKCLCAVHPDPVYIKHVGYKNAYCALCNYENIDLELKCGYEIQ